jgi:two-component system, NarL family, response regulator NreC
MIRILLADDHNLFRAGTRRILEEQPDFEVVAEAVSGLEAVELARRESPDVVVLDIGMKGLNGIEAASRIRAALPAAAVLVLSMHEDERYVAGALRAGVNGYLLKDTVEEDLIAAVREVHAGHTYFCPAVALRIRRDVAGARTDDRYLTLTERERHIYQLLAEGNSSKEIAARLGISVHTAETHRTRIMEKMNLHGIAELVLSAVRRGLVQ